MLPPLTPFQQQFILPHNGYRDTVLGLLDDALQWLA
jgi:hypothetical protein